MEGTRKKPCDTRGQTNEKSNSGRNKQGGKKAKPGLLNVWFCLYLPGLRWRILGTNSDTCRWEEVKRGEANFRVSGNRIFPFAHPHHFPACFPYLTPPLTPDSIFVLLACLDNNALVKEWEDFPDLRQDYRLFTLIVSSQGSLAFCFVLYCCSPLFISLSQT